MPGIHPQPAVDEQIGAEERRVAGGCLQILDRSVFELEDGTAELLARTAVTGRDSSGAPLVGGEPAGAAVVNCRASREKGMRRGRAALIGKRRIGPRSPQWNWAPARVIGQVAATIDDRALSVTAQAVRTPGAGDHHGIHPEDRRSVACLIARKVVCRFHPAPMKPPPKLGDPRSPRQSPR